MAAKSLGDVSLVWPQGCVIEDLPDDFFVALDHSIEILSWRENLMSVDEMPPRWMWHLDWKIKEWFEQVDAARKAKFDSKSNDSPVWNDDVVMNEAV